MQNDLDKLNKLAIDWGIKFSASKTVYVLFNKKGTVQDSFKLKSGDKFLSRVSECKFLGVTFDTQLPFKAHINNFIKITLNVLRAISITNWGAQTVTMVMVYKTYNALQN